jgi:hypothetical protein
MEANIISEQPKSSFPMNDGLNKISGASNLTIYLYKLYTFPFLLLSWIRQEDETLSRDK